MANAPERSARDQAKLRRLLWSVGLVSAGFAAEAFELRALAQSPRSSPQAVEIGKGYKVRAVAAEARFRCPSAGCGPGETTKEDVELPEGIEIELVFTPCVGPEESFRIQTGEEFVPPTSGTLDLPAERELDEETRRAAAARYRSDCSDLRIVKAVLGSLNLVPTGGR